MARFRVSPLFIIGVLIAIFFGVSLIFRICLPYEHVFGADWIKLTRLDAYYHMRLVDNLVYNFPHLTNFDPFFIYPGGHGVGGVYFFDWLLSGIIWVIGLGSPTQHTTDVVGVVFPAVLAALTVIPVYFIGKALFNRGAGVIAAALVAILPGEYLGRSILGSVDHHVAETLFSVTAVLFLILAIKEAGKKQLTLSHLVQRDWKVITKPLVYSLLAGIFLGIYLLTWLGALLFIFIIALYFIIQFIINHMRHKSSEYLGIIGIIMFVIAIIIFLPLSPSPRYTAAVAVAPFIPLVLAGASLLISGRGLKTFYYPLTLVGIGIVAVGIFYAISPQNLGWMFSQFKIFHPAGATAITTQEMQHFLSPQGYFTTGAAWGNFTTSFFLLPYDWGVKNLTWFPGFAIIPIIIAIWLYIKQRADKEHEGLFRILMVVMIIAALVLWFVLSAEQKILFPGFAFISFIILIWLLIKRRRDEKNWLFLIIWTVVILVATLVQRRFAYYLAINIALLSAYISWEAIRLAGLNKLTAKPEKIAEGAERAKARKEREHGETGITIYHVNVALAMIVVFLFVLFPNIGRSKEQAEVTPFAPSDAWQSSLIWLKENTPEPFGDPDAYYKLYERPLPEEKYEYPESAYGVTSWWDYGYWITRTAHRLPNTNNSQSPVPITEVANLFLSTEESLADEIMEELESSYVIIDYATCTSKFWAVVTWAERGQTEFVGTYQLPYEDKLIPINFFYPEYYRTMCVRLYNFNGEAVTTENAMVVKFDEKVDLNGKPYKEIKDVQEFPSYQEALDYVEREGPSNNSVVGINPFLSPISLEPVPNYKLIYSSESGISNPETGMIPEVKIFEYTGD